MKKRYLFLIALVFSKFCMAQSLDPKDMPAKQNPETIVQGNLDAYNAKDLNGFMAYFAPEIELYNFTNNELRAKGLDAIKKLYHQLFEASPQLHSTILNRIVFDNKVIDYERITGRMGSATPLEMVMIYEVKDDKIIRMTAIRK